MSAILSKILSADVLTNGEVRGLARDAARRNVQAGRAYREICRAYRVSSCSWTSFADAYDDEINR